jgi:hypothetical protein
LKIRVESDELSEKRALPVPKKREELEILGANTGLKRIGVNLDLSVKVAIE